ncbi:MAG: hypothetical protein ISS56_03270 [Anaerolineae bacterium]|nr:hypothetical protein [Anaerolineae bacterium]
MDKVEFLKRALTDPVFRRTLETNPQKILGRNVTQRDLESIKTVLRKARQVDGQIEALAGELLCADGGGCGLA